MLSWKPHKVKESAAVCDALFVFLTNKLIPYLISSILSTHSCSNCCNSCKNDWVAKPNAWRGTRYSCWITKKLLNILCWTSKPRFFQTIQEKLTIRFSFFSYVHKYTRSTPKSSPAFAFLPVIFDVSNARGVSVSGTWKLARTCLCHCLGSTCLSPEK